MMFSEDSEGDVRVVLPDRVDRSDGSKRPTVVIKGTIEGERICLRDHGRVGFDENASRV